MAQQLQPLLRRVLIGLGAVLATVTLLAVFGLYTEPDFMRLMADQVWACF